MIDLKAKLKQHPNCLNNRELFKSLLLNTYPTEKRTINILLILFESGIVTKMIKSRAPITPDKMHDFITQIENDYGISGQYSGDAILIWAAAFGITVSAVEAPPTVSSCDSVSAVENTPIVYVQGDVADYDIIQKVDGYYISHFNGFEEEDMTIPNLIGEKKITGIADAAFAGCVTVKTIHISEGIEIIENGAFENCKSLEHISFPNTLRKIGSPEPRYAKGAFQNTGLTSVILPQTVSFIGRGTFLACHNLTDVILSDNIKTIYNSTFSYCSKLSTVKLPKNLLTIKSGAFYDCPKLKEIKIPPGTKVIENTAFNGCRLSAIYIPPSVTRIGSPDDDPKWGDNTFGCGPFSGVTVPYDHTRQRTTIYCEAGSVAMEYARKYNIKCAQTHF